MIGNEFKVNCYVLKIGLFLSDGFQLCDYIMGTQLLVNGEIEAVNVVICTLM